MSLTAAAIRLMASKGMTAEDIADIAEAMEAPVPEYDAREAKRAYDRERMRAKRSQVVRRSYDVADDNSDKDARVTHAPTHVEDTSSSLRSEEVVVGGVVSAGATSDDWPEGKADRHAKLLLEAVGSPWLDPNKSPDLVTTRGRIAAWRRDGASWEHDVLPVVIGLCANRRSRISSWKFFDAAVSRSIAENRAALEIPIIGTRQANERPYANPKLAARQANMDRAAAAAYRVAEEARRRRGDGAPVDPGWEGLDA